VCVVSHNVYCEYVKCVCVRARMHTCACHCYISLLYREPHACLPLNPRPTTPPPAASSSRLWIPAIEVSSMKGRTISCSCTISYTRAAGCGLGCINLPCPPSRSRTAFLPPQVCCVRVWVCDMHVCVCACACVICTCVCARVRACVRVCGCMHGEHEHVCVTCPDEH